MQQLKNLLVQNEMMKETGDYWIYGASGHGKVILDCLLSTNVIVKGFIDDDSSKTNLNDLPVFRRSHINSTIDKIIFGIGENNIRKKLAGTLHFNYFTVIHPTVNISPFAQVEVGTVVFHHSVVQSGASVGKHCILNTKVSIDHDCIIGDYVHLSPGAILCGNVSVGELAWIGAGAVILQGVKIGKNAMIGAGSVIIRDVPDNAVVVGNPGKIINFKTVL